MSKRATLILGAVFLGAELTAFLLCLITDFSFANKILSMVTANHLGGRLAFIALGLEQGLSPLLIILIIVLYNTTYLLLAYTVFVFFSERVRKLKVLKNYVESVKNQAIQKKILWRRWNWLSIFLFVWIPLPWTGAVIGSYIAHLEGFSTRETLLTVVPSMWIGIVSWTLWFDELYEIIGRFGRGKTMILTVLLLVIPIVCYAWEALKRKKRGQNAGVSRSFRISNSGHRK